jgi:hypothetical protein
MIVIKGNYRAEPSLPGNCVKHDIWFAINALKSINFWHRAVEVQRAGGIPTPDDGATAARFSMHGRPEIYAFNN